MYEKVNPVHADKLADRIAGALVDLAYRREKNPRTAAEVLLGHGECHIIAESSVSFTLDEVEKTARRIAGPLRVSYLEVPQDARLAENQKGRLRCGDNGIFKGMPVTDEQKKLCEITRKIYTLYPFDGKYILDGEKVMYADVVKEV